MILLDHPDALAAYGAAQFEAGAPLPLDDLPEPLRDILERQLRTGYARVRLGSGDLVLEDGRADELATAWSDGCKEYPGDGTPRGIRVRLELVGTDEWTPPYAALRRASSVSSVFLADYTCAGSRRWRWPVRIGSIPGGAFYDPIDSYYHRDLIELIDIGPSATVCDLAVVTDSEVDQAASITTASLVLVIAADPTLITLDYARELAAGFEASAVALTTDPIGRHAFATGFLDGLAHNHPPDLALGIAAADAEYLVIGDPDFLDAARVTAAVTEVRRAIEHEWGRKRLEDAEMESALESLQGLEDMYWASEGGGSTEAARRVSRVEPMLHDATVLRSGERSPTAEGEVTPSPRYLQTQVNAHSNDGSQRRRLAFRPDCAHEIVVRVGRTSAEWNRAGIEFPSWRLPAEERHYELTIDLRAPALFDGLQSEVVLLGHVGDSSTATFTVDVPAGVERVELSVSVFYRGLHLQTATLTGPVAEADQDPHGDGIRLLRGDGSTADLDAKPDLDMSFTKEGDVIKVWHRGEEPWDLSLPGINTQVAALRKALFNAATGVQQLETRLHEEDGLGILVALADHGWELRSTLVGTGNLRDVRRVAVSSPASADWLPVEFLYDFGLPDEGAQLCPQFLATTDGLCDGCKAQNDTAYVCPSGFWGLNRHIEQQVWAEAQSGRDSECQAPTASGAKPRLPAARNVVFAASSLVNEDNANQIDKTVASMKAAIGDLTPRDDPHERVHRASSWGEWATLVAQHYPSLLVALPHKVTTPRLRDALQIAADQDLAINRLEQVHVAPKDHPAGPVVLLLGCNTANAAFQYQDFIQRFRCKGAAIVVGTLTYVLGPEMSRVAESFVRHLWAARGEASFGEIMQRVRTTMLRQDNVMTLALVAYGDADWRFVPGGD